MENKLSDIIQTTLQNVKSIVESNTVIGDPLSTTNGVTIIPVSKVSMGFASGGLDYSSKKEEKEKGKNFGGGGGTGVSVTPMAFLVIKPDGNVDIINISTPDTAVNKIAGIGNIIEKSPDIIERIKNVFSKDGKSEE